MDVCDAVIEIGIFSLTRYQHFRCYYIALSFLSGQKWAEAMALFQRATAYSNKAKNDKNLAGEMSFC